MNLIRSVSNLLRRVYRSFFFGFGTSFFYLKGNRHGFVSHVDDVVVFDDEVFTARRRTTRFPRPPISRTPTQKKQTTTTTTTTTTKSETKIKQKTNQRKTFGGHFLDVLFFDVSAVECAVPPPPPLPPPTDADVPLRRRASSLSALRFDWQKRPKGTGARGPDFDLHRKCFLFIYPHTEHWITTVLCQTFDAVLQFIIFKGKCVDGIRF